MGLPVIALVAAAGLQAAGQISQGRAASEAASYSAQVAENNAKIATQNARMAGAEGDQNTAAAELKNKAQMGSILAAQGANGVDVNSGSAVAVRQSAAELGQLNASNIRANAARQAYGYETQAAADTGQAAVDRSTAKNDMTGGLISGAGSLLSGAGSAASNFANFQGDKSTFNLNDFTFPQSQ